MKFIHLSDLHLGKRVNNFSMIEDQKYIMQQILSILDDEKPDGVLIAGDIYDKSIPSAEAVALCDDFLYQLVSRKLQVFLISGNHDSAERLAFGSRLFDASGVHISPAYHGDIQPVTLHDAHGAVDVYMLPFIKPIVVRSVYPDAEIESYNDAVRVAVEHLPVDEDHRNVLVAHQFVTGAELSDSEEIFVGSLENIDGSMFDAFDYVALGHIHRPQNVKGERMRYCGTPLKYSFSEANHKKSVTVMELGEKGSLTVRTVPLVPLRDLVEIRGSYEEVTARSFYQHTNWQDDYVHITLTDEEDIYDALGKLRSIYHNIMKMDYDNLRTKQRTDMQEHEASKNKQPIEYFADLYTLQNNQPMNDEQSEFLNALIASIWEERQ